MSKESAEFKRHAVPAMAISLACYIIAIFIYTRFDSVNDPRIEDRTPLALPLFLTASIQGFFSFGSRKPWAVFPFFWILAMLISSTSGFYTMGMIQHQALVKQHVQQIIHLKWTVTLVLPIVIAFACQAYLSWEKSPARRPISN